MNQSALSDLAVRAMYIAAMVSLPILIVCLAVGIIISIFQATTQIHEQSLTFVPKILAVMILLAVMGSWIVAQLSLFTHEVFSRIAGIT